MIRSYGEFDAYLVKMIKIRAANYVETDCDIEALIETAYNDIQNSILMETTRELHSVSEDTDLFNLYSINSEETKYSTDVLDIIDENEKSIMHLLHQVDDLVWRWNVDSCGNHTLPCCIGDNIYFVRKVVSHIENLSAEWYQRLMFPMLEGMMYYIQTAIPNQVDGQVGNFSYQRFYNAKKVLMDDQPQHRFYLTEEKKWL